MRLIRPLLVLFVLSIAACSGDKKSGGDEEQPTKLGSKPAPATSAGAGAAKAKEIYATRCTPCHGTEGRGDGVASAGLTPKPRNFHDATFQAEATDEHIQKIIQYGGAAVGKAAAMPGNPDLTDAAVIAGLKDVVREFGKNP
jgi:mono/diheme cytochrome c family protein